jgi:hypothetical protein
MVDDMISMNEDKSAYFLGPAVNGVDGFLGRSLTRNEILEEAMGLMQVKKGGVHSA